jgi:hypothetical protein
MSAARVSKLHRMLGASRSVPVLLHRNLTLDVVRSRTYTRYRAASCWFGSDISSSAGTPQTSVNLQQEEFNRHDYRKVSGSTNQQSPLEIGAVIIHQQSHRCRRPVAVDHFVVFPSRRRADRRTRFTRHGTTQYTDGKRSEASATSARSSPILIAR